MKDIDWNFHLLFVTQCDRNMSKSEDCVLGHQLSILCLVLSVEPVRHREDERLDDVLLVGPHARPECLAEILNGGVPEFVESDHGRVRLLRFFHLCGHILVAVGHY